MKFFKSTLYRVFTSKQYLAQLGTAFFLSIFGIFLLKEMKQEMMLMPKKVLEAFRMGRNYNIGIVALPDLSVLDELYCDEIIGGIFSGSMAQMLIVFAVVSFLCSEIQNGYLYIAVMKGQNRFKICFQYLGTSVIIVMPIMLAFIIGALATLRYNQMTAVKNPVALCITLFTQMFMMLGISVCAATLPMMMGEKDTKIIAMCLILALQFVPKILYVLTQGKIQIEQWILVSQLVSSGNMEGNGIMWNLLLTLLTVAVFTVGEMFIFQTKTIE